MQIGSCLRRQDHAGLAREKRNCDAEETSPPTSHFVGLSALARLQMSNPEQTGPSSTTEHKSGTDDGEPKITRVKVKKWNAVALWAYGSAISVRAPICSAALFHNMMLEFLAHF